MSDDATTTNPKRPAHTVSFIPERENSPWIPIGAAWTHKDGDGFSLILNLLPNVPGRLCLRTIKPKEV